MGIHTVQRLFPFDSSARLPKLSHSSARQSLAIQAIINDPEQSKVLKPAPTEMAIELD